VADWSLGVVVVPVAVPPFVHLLERPLMPDWSHELGVVVVLDCVPEVVVVLDVVVVLGPRAGPAVVVVVGVVLVWSHDAPMSL
jgi:hypothetical protein